jgi:Ca2+/Na+ antiporter
MADMAPVFVLISFTAGLVWIVWIVFNNQRRIKIAQIQREMHAKLFEKFGTSQELVEYLKTDAGSKFLDSATIEHAKPFGRVLGSVQAGIVLTLVGLAMIFVRATLPHPAFFSEIERAQTAESFLIIGVLLLALGIGFLTSAAASYWLSKNWGLMDRDSARQR